MRKNGSVSQRSLIMEEHIKFISSIPTEHLERIRNVLAPSIKEGIDLYKQMVGKGKDLCPLKLALFGPFRSMFLFESEFYKSFEILLGESPLQMWSGTPSLIKHHTYGNGLAFNTENQEKIGLAMKKA